jgi:hypothetical protein
VPSTVLQSKTLTKRQQQQQKQQQSRQLGEQAIPKTKHGNNYSSPDAFTRTTSPFLGFHQKAIKILTEFKQNPVHNQARKSKKTKQYKTLPELFFISLKSL